MSQTEVYRFNVSIFINGIYSGQRNEQPPIDDWLEVRENLSSLISDDSLKLNSEDPIKHWIEELAKQSSQQYLEEIKSFFPEDETRTYRIQISELNYSPGSLWVDFAYSVTATGITYVSIKGMIHQFKIDLQSSLRRVTFGYVDVHVKKNVYKFKLGRNRTKKFKVKKSYITALSMILIFAIAMWYNSYTSKQQRDEMRQLIREETKQLIKETLKAIPEKKDSIP